MRPSLPKRCGLAPSVRSPVALQPKIPFEVSLSACLLELAQVFSHLAFPHPMGIKKENDEASRNSPLFWSYPQIEVFPL